jgi:hypothetical protein
MTGNSNFDDLSPELLAAIAAAGGASAGTAGAYDTLSPALLAAIGAHDDSGEAGAPGAPARRRGTALDAARRIERLAERQMIAAMRRAERPSMRPPVAAYAGPPVRIGFDAEWVTLPDGRGGWRNHVLCVSAVLACGGRRTAHIVYTAGDKREARPSMVGFVQAMLRKALREKVVAAMPDRIVLFAHFMRGDLSSFSDFWRHKAAFRTLGTTLVSGRAGHAVDVAPGDGAAAGRPAGEPGDAPPPREATLRDLASACHTVRLRFVDTIRLTPGRRGLAAAARMIGRGKLDLHGDLGVPDAPAAEAPARAQLGLVARYGKARMDLVLRDYPQAFEQYALEDARIALEYGLWMEQVCAEEFGLRSLPNSLASIAARRVCELAGGREALAADLGRVVFQEQHYNARKRVLRTIKREDASAGLRAMRQFAVDCYHGGRNECFYHGPTEVGAWFDYDLPGAYTTALAALRPVDYDNIREERDADAYGPLDMGLARIAFEFPPGTRFPCIPVRIGAGGLVFPLRGGEGGLVFPLRGGEGGLVFPLRGGEGEDVFATSPEIFLARRMGASVRIVQGFKAAWKSDRLIFEAFTREVQGKRRAFPKSTHPGLNELWKEVGNSAYGLLAQGLKEKRAFDTASMASKPIGDSLLTEPLLAAWVTGYIRAVLGEVLAGLPADGRVISATTDGLLTDVHLDRMDLTGPLCASFADIRERLFGGREVLDPAPKHGARQLVSVAVRTTFTAKQAEGLDLVCAKGSVKPPTGPEPRRQNRHMLKLYLGQHFGQTVAHEQLVSAREQFTRECDLVGVERARRLNLRFDLKRRPVAPRMMGIGRRRARIAWDTLPWGDAAEAGFARRHLEAWTHDRERLLLSMADYRDFQSYHAASRAMDRAARAAGVRGGQVRADNAAGVLKRVFLQAGRQQAWGLLFPSRGMAALAKYLTEAGCPTSKEDITYAGRRKTPLLEHCVAWVPETVDLLRIILARFPEFDYRRAFEDADDATLASVGFAPGEGGGGDAKEAIGGEVKGVIDTAAAIAPASNEEVAHG